MSSLRPCLRPDLSFRKQASRTVLVDPSGRALLELVGAEIDVVSVMDGATALDELVATARAVGVPDDAAVPALVERLRAAGCLQEPRADDAPGTGLVLEKDELMRKAVILASRGLDGPARNVLAQLEARAPGSEEAADLLAVLDAEAVMAVDDVAQASAEARRREAEAPVLEAPPPTYRFAPKSPPARVGQVGRARLKRLRKLALVLGVLAVIPYRAGVHGPATLRPERVEVLRSGVHGVLDRILVADGASVDAGQPLLAFEEGPTQTRIATLEAAIEALRAQHRELERGGDPAALVTARAATSAAAALVAHQSEECAQIAEQVRSGVLAASALDACQQDLAGTRTRSSVARAQLVGAAGRADPAALRASEARIRASQAMLDEARRSLETLVVRSPFAGRLIAPGIQARRGELVDVGAQLGHVTSGRAAIARVLLEPRDTALVAEGSEVILRTRAFGERTLRGRITHIAPTLENGPDGSPRLVVEARVPTPVPLGVLDLPAAAEIKAGWSVLLLVASRRVRGWLTLEVLPRLS